MSEKHLNKDKVIDDLLLLIAEKNKRIKELEEEYEHLEPTDVPIEGIKFEGVV